MNSISRVRDSASILHYPWPCYSGCGFATETIVHEKVETFSIEVEFDHGGRSEVETQLPFDIPSTDTNSVCIERSDTVVEESFSTDSLNWDIPSITEEFPTQSSFLSPKTDWNSQLIGNDPYLFSVSDVGDSELKSINSSLSPQEPKFVDPYEADQDKASKSSKDSSENEMPLQINSAINLKSVNGWLPGIKDPGTNEAWKNDFSQSNVMLNEFLEIEELNNSVNCEDSHFLNGSHDDEFVKTDIDEHLPPVKENINEWSFDSDAEKRANLKKYQEYKKKCKLLSKTERSRGQNFCSINTRNSENDTNFMPGPKSTKDEKKDKENFVNHRQKYRKDKSLIDPEMYKCNFCGKVYASAGWFKKHKCRHLCEVSNVHHNLNCERNKLTSAKKANSKIKECSIVLSPLKTLSKVPAASVLKVSRKNSENVNSENVNNGKIKDNVLKNRKTCCSSQISKSSSAFFHDNITDKVDPKCISQEIKHYNTRSCSKTVSTLTNENKIKKKYEITSVEKTCIVRGVPISSCTHLSEEGSSQTDNCSIAEKGEHDRCNSTSDSVSRKRQSSTAIDVNMQPVVKLRRLDPEFLRNMLPSAQLPENKTNKQNKAVSQNSCDVQPGCSKNSFPRGELSGYSSHKNFLRKSSYLVHSCEEGTSDDTSVNKKFKGKQLKESVNSGYKVSEGENRTIITRSKSKQMQLQARKSDYSLDPLSKVTIATRIHSAEATYVQKSSARSLSSDASTSCISADISKACTRKTRLQVKTHTMTSGDNALLNSQLKPMLHDVLYTDKIPVKQNVNIGNQSKCLKTKNYASSECSHNLRSKASIPNETSTLTSECAAGFPNESNFNCNASTSTFKKNINLKQDTMDVTRACCSSSVRSEGNGTFIVKQKGCDISVKKLDRKVKSCDNLKTVNGLVIFDKKTPVVKIERLKD